MRLKNASWKSRIVDQAGLSREQMRQRFSVVTASLIGCFYVRRASRYFTSIKWVHYVKGQGHP